MCCPAEHRVPLSSSSSSSSHPHCPRSHERPWAGRAAWELVHHPGPGGQRLLRSTVRVPILPCTQVSSVPVGAAGVEAAPGSSVPVQSSRGGVELRQWRGCHGAVVSLRVTNHILSKKRLNVNSWRVSKRVSTSSNRPVDPRAPPAFRPPRRNWTRCRPAGWSSCWRRRCRRSKRRCGYSSGDGGGWSGSGWRPRKMKCGWSHRLCRRDGSCWEEPGFRRVQGVL